MTLIRSVVHQIVQKILPLATTAIQGRQIGSLADLYKRTVLNEETGCREWTGARNSGGYGNVGVNYKPFRAHRLAYMYFHNVVLGEGEFVCHICDNPPYINVEHLFLGNALINAQDKESKGRHIGPRGEKAGTSKLSDEKVYSIRKRLAQGEPQKSIAADFDVTPSTISRINKGLTWKHILPTSEWEE